MVDLVDSDQAGPVKLMECIERPSAAVRARDSKPIQVNLANYMSTWHDYKSSLCLIFGTFFSENEWFIMA